jgi:hypothetical protein
MALAPVILFGYNRPDLFKVTIDSLKANGLANYTDLYIFIDGPRNDADVPKVQEVRRLAEEAEGFSSKIVSVSDTNHGLAKSIIAGTTEIINKYGRVIVLEDDLFLSPGFLTFMNTMLDAYEADDRVFQISGFGTKVKVPNGYTCDYYLNTRAQSWSWATWKDRWNSVDWEARDYEEFAGDKAQRRIFRKSGSDLLDAIEGYKYRRSDIWFICFTYNMFRQGKYSINPIRSLVRNDGFRADAVHTRNYNRYKIDFNDSIQDYPVPQTIEWNAEINKSAVKYWQVRYRMYGKIMTVLKRIVK